MSKLFESLDDQDVQLIDRLVETLNRSSFDFFRLESGATTLVIGKGLPPADGAQQPAAAQTPAVVAPAAAVVAAPAPVVEPDAATPSSGQDTVAAQPVVVEEGTIPVVSPTVGRFYSRPEPTAEPFVAVGAEVTEDSTIGLVEVMKLFNAVNAEVNGTVSQILVEDGAFVEHGQVLMTIRPHAANAKEVAA